ncbi:prepilin-type N-terminal cleavage/methylation domain-containing protein [Candidatus Peregrinibacteria bacterium]|nr:MAG: prepilin-type N-terminal cleavage/methylation domain-containing protein [Candidatus Peregrinibacteria bacterium]
MFITKQIAGFTLIELMIAMALFAFISSFIFQQFFLVRRFEQTIRLNQILNHELATALQFPIASSIREAVSIDYDQSSVNELTLFTNPSETEQIRFFLQPLSFSDESNSTSRWMFQNQQGHITSVLSNNIFIDELQFDFPPFSPHTHNEIAPYVSIVVRAHIASDSRLPNEFNEPFQAWYRVTYALRNRHSAIH